MELVFALAIANAITAFVALAIGSRLAKCQSKKTPRKRTGGGFSAHPDGRKPKREQAVATGCE